MTSAKAFLAVTLLVLVPSVVGCSASDAERVATFDAIGPDERVLFAGNEPFWSGEVFGGKLSYRTPERPAGEVIPVERFAGNNGLSFSGQLDGRPFDLAVTPGSCADTMADRTYPYTVTLSVGRDVRFGCAWTEREPYRNTGS